MLSDLPIFSSNGKTLCILFIKPFPIGNPQINFCIVFLKFCISNVFTHLELIYMCDVIERSSLIFLSSEYSFMSTVYWKIYSLSAALPLHKSRFNVNVWIYLCSLLGFFLLKMDLFVDLFDRKSKQKQGRGRHREREKQAPPRAGSQMGCQA